LLPAIAAYKKEISLLPIFNSGTREQALGPFKKKFHWDFLSRLWDIYKLETGYCCLQERNFFATNIQLRN